MKARRKLLSLMVVITLLGFAGTAIAQGQEKKLDPAKIQNVKESSPYITFMETIKEGRCTPNGYCADKYAAEAANLEMESAKLTIQSTFPRKTKKAYIKILGKWANVTFNVRPASVKVSNEDPRVVEVQDSSPFKSFDKVRKHGECKWVNRKKAICKDERAANKANRRLESVRRTIRSRFGASMAPAAYEPVLGKWVDITFTSAGHHE